MSLVPALRRPPVLPDDRQTCTAVALSFLRPPPHRLPSPFTRAVSIRNTKNTLFKNLLDVCCSAIAFFFFGFAFLHGKEGEFIGTSDFALGTKVFTENNIGRHKCAQRPGLRVLQVVLLLRLCGHEHHHCLWCGRGALSEVQGIRHVLHGHHRLGVSGGGALVLVQGKAGRRP